MAIRKLSLGGMNWGRAARWLDRAVPVGFGLVLLMAVPLRTALTFGRNEGYELMKALLVRQGHPLYGDFWNDQPPLHTEVVALLFRVFGPSAYVGRLLTLCLAMALVAALYRLASRGSGRATGLAAVGLLASSSYFLQLSVSAMLDLPAMALAVVAVWAWSSYFDGKGKRWLVLSGVFFGCALQVKLTSAIFLPALGVDYVARQMAQRREPEKTAGRGHWIWGRCREGLVWGGAAAGIFEAIAVLFYRGHAWSVFMASHFSAGTREGAQRSVFHPASLQDDLALLIAAAVGLVMLGWKRLPKLMFPAVLLATVLAIHWWHRPYWYFYRLHFAIPLAWLGATGMVEAFRAFWKLDLSSSWAARVRMGIGWVIWSLAVSAVLTLAPEKAWWELRKLQRAAPALEDRRVVELRDHAAGTHWVFSEDRIRAFWAGLPIVPELAVIPNKRIWSRQIDSAYIRACLERYRPELVFLGPGRVKEFGLTEYLEEHYRRDPSSVWGLFLRKE